ncbi:MAG: phosphatase PAP2 family protein [Candidatus Moranbacteria bacterium]|jgi:undecaprenyl-diphosphatase|nr:phosphatase PAP2 family protein [Candidatus Moranbacteria bacterium]
MDSIIIFGAQYLYLVIVIAALLFLLIVPKQRSSEVLVAAFFSLPLTYIAAKTLSLFYFDPRPFVVDHFVPLLSHAADNGFPSDHTLFSAALAAVIFAFHRKLGLALYSVAFLVGLSRVAAGIHHLTDIVGSLVIASFVTYVVLWLVLPSVWQHMPKSLRTFFLE